MCLCVCVEKKKSCTACWTLRRRTMDKMKGGLTSDLIDGINGIKPYEAADPSKAPDKASASASASDAPVRITGVKRNFCVL